MTDNSERQISAAPSCRDPPPMVDRRGVAIILWRVLTNIETNPLTPPQPPADLPDMPALARLHACLRLFLLDIEYALSPGGHLRGIFKLACRISVALAFLALGLAGVLTWVVLVLATVVVIARQLIVILWNLLMAALLLMAFLVLAAVLLLTVRFLVRSVRK